MPQVLKVIRDVRRRAVLEVVFRDEEGSGLGPTLEFYNMLGEELRADKTMWRQGVTDGSLYPCSLQITDEHQAEAK